MSDDIGTRAAISEIELQRNNACARAAQLAGQVAILNARLAEANKKIESLQAKPPKTKRAA